MRIVSKKSLTALFKDYIGIIGIFTFIFTVWLIIFLAIQFKNRFLIFKHNEKEIYVRDVNVEYSPAVLSYLINNNNLLIRSIPINCVHFISKYFYLTYSFIALFLYSLFQQVYRE